MFDHPVLRHIAASPYHAVVVTGPQRSGTTIAARIISAEMGGRYVDEDEFGIHSDGRAQALIDRGDAVVLQAPGLAHAAHLLQNCVIVFLYRPLDAIHKSEERIHWRTAYDGANVMAEQQKYWALWKITGEDVAKLKYWVWEQEQKDLCACACDLAYDSLRGHPLFKAEGREHFTERQYA